MRYDEMVNKVKNGDIVSLNRNKQEILKVKQEKGGITASSQFLRGRTSRTIKCQPTPNGELVRRLSKALNSKDNSEAILVAEDGGRPAMSSLRQADPFFPGGYCFNDDNSPVEKGKDCSQQGILYEITCNNCKEPVDSNNVQEKESRKPGCQARYNYLG